MHESRFRFALLQFGKVMKRRSRKSSPLASDEALVPFDQLSREALRTEKLRVIVLLSFTGILAIVSLIPPPMLFDGLDPQFRENMDAFMYWRFVLISGLIIYLVSQRLVVYYLTKTKRRQPPI